MECIIIGLSLVCALQGSSKPTTVTRTFIHPITEELLQTIWDEQTLQLLVSIKLKIVTVGAYILYQLYIVLI